MAPDVLLGARAADRILEPGCRQQRGAPRFDGGIPRARAPRIAAVKSRQCGTGKPQPWDRVSEPYSAFDPTVRAVILCKLVGAPIEHTAREHQPGAVSARLEPVCARRGARCTGHVTPYPPERESFGQQGSQYRRFAIGFQIGEMGEWILLECRGIVILDCDIGCELGRRDRPIEETFEPRQIEKIVRHSRVGAPRISDADLARIERRKAQRRARRASHGAADRLYEVVREHNRQAVRAVVIDPDVAKLLPVERLDQAQLLR